MNRDERAAAIDAAAREVDRRARPIYAYYAKLRKWGGGCALPADPTEGEQVDFLAAMTKLRAALDAEVAPEPPSDIRTLIERVYIATGNGAVDFKNVEALDEALSRLFRDPHWQRRALYGDPSSRARIAELEAEVARLTAEPKGVTGPLLDRVRDLEASNARLREGLALCRERLEEALGPSGG